jgi:arabinofuranosyltransferase
MSVIAPLDPGPPTRARPRGWAVWIDSVAILAAATGAVLWYLHVRAGLTAPGFPLDDAWIHLQFARNIAEGAGFSFNAGIPSSGSTAPLWTMVVAIPLAAGLGPIAGALVPGLVCYAMTALAAAALARRVLGSRSAGLLAGLAVAVAPRFVWAGVSGMEVPLYAGLVTLGLVMYLKAADGHRWRFAWGLLVGLAGCARPETFLVAPILMTHWWWTGARDERGQLRAGWWHPIAACTAVVVAFVLFNERYGGHPLPNTFYAKTYGMGTLLSLKEGRPWDALIDASYYPFDFLDGLTRLLATQNLFLFGAMVTGLLSLAGALGEAPAGGRIIVAILLLTPLVKALVAPEPSILVHDGRYIAHLLVLTIVTCTAGFAALARVARPRWLVPVLAVGALAQLTNALGRGADTYAAEVKNINDLQLVTAHWLDTHTGRDARIATNDIGAMAFFTRRFIIDTEGLITPEAIKPKRDRKLAPFLEQQRPDVLVIFPEWYPELAARTDVLTEIAEFSATRVIAGGRTLVVYRMPWTRPDRLLLP